MVRSGWNGAFGFPSGLGAVLAARELEARAAGYRAPGEEIFELPEHVHGQFPTSYSQTPVQLLPLSVNQTATKN